MLLIHADERVGRDALTEAVWGAKATPRSQSTLESHVWRLRKLLEPDRAHGAPSTVLLHDVAGYRLLATVDQVDSLRFTQLVGEAADLLAADQPDRALQRTADALALWRGRPCSQDLGNVYAAWMASGAAANAALQSGDVEEGLRWSDRMVSQHVTLGVGEGPLVLEVRASLLAVSGDARAAVRLYAAARGLVHTAGIASSRSA